MGQTTYLDSDASRIEQLVLRHLPHTLKSSGFAFNDSEPCRRLLATLGRPVRRLSEFDSADVAAQLNEPENTKTKQDLISIKVNEQIVLHASAITRYAYAINATEISTDVEFAKISCTQGMESSFILGSIYEKSISELNNRKQYKPKSKKFQKKHRKNKRRSIWPLSGKDDSFKDDDTE